MTGLYLQQTLFHPESFYEVWSVNPELLLKVANYFDKNDKVAITRISFGGYRES